MLRLNIVVEGETEETFVRDVLSKYLQNHHIYAVARSVGGISKYSYNSKMKQEISRWCKQDKNARVTSLFDLYGLPQDFPGLDQAKKVNDIYEKVLYLETQFAEDIACNNFIPHLQLYEFESLLFSDVTAFSNISNRNSLAIDELHKIRNSADTPEHINDNPETAPSKRILHLFPNYQKPLHGSIISIQIGIDKIREECKHFDQWIKFILALNKITEQEVAT